jgi:hypothetical protein
MNDFKKNTDNLVPTILFIVLALILCSFAINENRYPSHYTPASISMNIDDFSKVSAVIPVTTDIPVCASFTNENLIFRNPFTVSNFVTNLRINKEYNTFQDKLLLIKPLLNKVFRRLTFPDSDSNDFIAIG